MKQTFSTSVGMIEVLVDTPNRIVSIYRFDDEHRPISAAIESWDHVDLVDVLNRQAGVPLGEASRIAATLHEQHFALGTLAHRIEEQTSERPRWSGALENAGVPLRFVAVLLDALIVFLPAGLVIALLTGGGYSERGDGYWNAGIEMGDKTFWTLLVLGIGYYTLCEAASGATLGKRIVGIRVVREDGAHVSLGAAFVRNLLRPVDALFFYLVGAVFALTSQRGQRLGDRAAHTVVVRS